MPKNKLSMHSSPRILHIDSNMSNNLSILNNIFYVLESILIANMSTMTKSFHIRSEFKNRVQISPPTLIPICWIHTFDWRFFKHPLKNWKLVDLFIHTCCGLFKIFRRKVFHSRINKVDFLTELTRILCWSHTSRLRHLIAVTIISYFSHTSCKFL